jgi:hypothetical protein
MAESEEVLFALFTELDAAIGSEDFSRAVSTADKSLLAFLLPLISLN